MRAGALVRFAPQVILLFLEGHVVLLHLGELVEVLHVVLQQLRLSGIFTGYR